MAEIIMPEKPFLVRVWMNLFHPMKCIECEIGDVNILSQT